MPPKPNLRSGDEDMEKLITKICSSFVSQLEEKLTAKLEKLDNKISDLCDALKGIATTVHENTENLTKMQHALDVLDQRCRKNNIRVCGIEEEEREDIRHVVANVLTEKLGLSVAPTDIDGAFRVGQSSEGQPRAVIVSFLSNYKRNEVFYAKSKLKGTPYVIYEDLTQLRFNLLLAAKKKLGRNMVWSSGGNIYLMSRSGKRQIKSSSDF